MAASRNISPIDVLWQEDVIAGSEVVCAFDPEKGHEFKHELIFRLKILN